MDTGALQLMFQNGMQSMGAMGLGQGQTADQQLAAQKLRAATMDNDQNAVMNPLNAQFRQGQIAQQGAELPGLVGISQSRAAQGTEDTQLMASKIAEKFSNMSTQIGANGMQQMGQDAEKLLHAAQIVKQLPPAMQKQAFTKAIQQYGASPDNPMFKGLMSAPDEEFQKAAEALGQGMALSSSKFVQTQTAALSHQASQEKINTADNTSREKIAEIAAKSRVDASDKRTQAAMNHMNMDQKFAYLSGIPESDLTPTEAAQLNKISSQRLGEKAAPATALAPTVMNQKTPQQAAQELADKIAPVKAQADHGDLELAKAAQQQWGNTYDPKVYTYKMVNGVAMRNKK